MHQEIEVPDLGDGVTEGFVLEWLKKVGDPAVEVADTGCWHPRRSRQQGEGRSTHHRAGAILTVAIERTRCDGQLALARSPTCGS